MKLVIGLILMLAWGSGGFSGSAEKKTDKVIKKIWADTNIKKSLINLSDIEIPDEININKKRVYKITTDKNDTYLCILSKAKGRFDYFEYVVIIDSNLNITKTKVLVYNSSHGYEITNKRWLKQFNGSGKTFNYGKNIDAVSGATYSGESITNDINTINQIAKHLKRKALI